MQGELVMPLKMTQEFGRDDLDYMMVLNDKKEIVWVNGKAAAFFQSDLCVEHHLHPSSVEKWYRYLEDVKQSTIKKSHVSLLNKRNRLVHFIAYGVFNHWNETYVINFRLADNQLSMYELYEKTFKMLDEMHIGAYVSRLNGFIFSANETAKYIVPNACQMSIVTLFRKFFVGEQFAQYIKLLNNRESFSIDVTCPTTKENYHLIYRFDRDFDLHVVMIQHLLMKEIVEQRTKTTDYIDKETAASIVHEIRNPMTALQGFIDLMTQDETNNPQYLKLLANELQRMEHLLSGMLLLLKPKVECQPIECNRFLQKILLLLEVEVKNKNICLVYSQSNEPCYILANEVSLSQIFINIIKNSIQAMNANGSIAITFNKTTQHELEICIKDSGCGMSEEQLVHLFTPYYTTKENGTGLGLSIVKKLLEEMDGRIEIRSELGAGTEVFIFLQLAGDCHCNFTN